MDKKKLWSIAKLLLKIVITCLSLYFVFKKVDIKDVQEAFTRSNPLYLLTAFLFFVLSQIVSASRLNSFFKGINLNISEVYNAKIYLLGMFYNLFLPGGIGGDGYKIFLLRKKFDIKGRKLFQAIFFDRLSGLWALTLILSALVIFIPKFEIPQWLPIVAVTAGSIIYYFVMKKLFAEFSTNFFITHFKAILVQSLQIVCVIFLLYALHFNGKFSPYLLMFLLSSLVAIFPFTMGGLGAREVVFLYGADKFNMDPHIAVLISLLFYCTSAILSFTGLYFVMNSSKLKEVGDLDEDLKTEIA